MTKYSGRAFSVRSIDRSRKLPLKKRVLHILPLVLLLLTACAQAPKRAAAGSEPLTASELQAEDQALSARMSAEFARQDGDAGAQLRALVEAARHSTDPLQTKLALRAALAVSDNELADSLLARFSELDTQSSEPRAWAVALALHLGQSERAWSLAHAPGQPELENRQLGEALAAVPVRERVLPFIERTVANTEDLTMALRWCAFVRRLNESELATILVSQLVDRFPTKAEALAWRGQLKKETEDIAGAKIDFLAALERDPDSRFLKLSLAQIEDAEGDSLAATRRVAGIKPADDLVIQAQVAYAAKSEDKTELRNAYAALESLPEPRPDLRLKLLGTVAELLGDRESAVRWLLSVPDGTEQGESWLRAAVLLNEQGKNEQALDVVHELRGKSGVARDVLMGSYLIEGHLLTISNRRSEALELYSAGISLLPDEPQLLYARALEYAERGDTEKAEADLRRVLALQPEHADAMNALGYTLADKTQRFNEALALIQSALALKPDDGAVLDSMGWVHFRMGKIEQAVGYLRAAYAKAQDVEIAAHLGEALWASGQKDEARKVWLSARKREPKNAVLLETMQRHAL